MKTLSLIVGLLMVACQPNPWDHEVAVSADCPAYAEWKKAAELREVPGTVVNEAETSQTSTWIYIQTSDNTRYFACNLPTSVQKTGTKVVFNADEFAPPPNVRLAGVPVKLTKLRTAP
ncbi:hypothetical protein [Larkinella punicea]|uniref:Lipoprotein n=1 Tax=Larkinella punicea TaxID=2315727 RepID=A0A368JGK0_9BACT|nr:hypothetical protein [Larkinella punicea]RCR66798.1 hypothetical protein DUE52_24920 [Larkinella punicea]